MAKTVILTDLRTREARDAADYLSLQGYDVISVPETVCLWKECALRGWAEQLSGNLAGVVHPMPPPFLSLLLDTTEEEYARARDEGPLAAWCVTKVFGEIMRKQGCGSLIYLGSIHAEKPVGHGFLFSAGCDAIQMLAREANQDYGRAGVRSYYIQRGPGQGDPDLRNDLSPFYFGTDLRYPERKMPKEGNLNPLLAFLLTPGAAPLAGSDLRADGGMSMYYGERITEAQSREIRLQAAEGKEVSIIGEE